MNIKQILLSVFSGTLVYVLLSFCCGESGVWAKLQLEKQKEALVVNIQHIKTTHDELALRKIALINDHDVISSYARNLGFIQDNEKIVKISGIPVRTTLHPSIGKKYLKSKIQCIPEWICKCLGTVFFLLTFIVLFLSGIAKKKPKRNSVYGTLYESY